MQFKLEMIQEAEEGLKEIGEKVKKIQDREFTLMRGLYTDSQTSGQGKSLFGVELMKNKFSTYFNNFFGMTSRNQNRVEELQTLGGCVHVTMEELPNQLNVVNELAQEDSKWLLRFTNVHVPNHEELIPIIVATEAYRVKVENGKKYK